MKSVFLFGCCYRPHKQTFLACTSISANTRALWHLLQCLDHIKLPKTNTCGDSRVKQRALLTVHGHGGVVHPEKKCDLRYTHPHADGRSDEALLEFHRKKALQLMWELQDEETFYHFSTNFFLHLKIGHHPLQ